MAYPEPRSKEELKGIKDGATFYKELREENIELKSQVELLTIELGFAMDEHDEIEHLQKDNDKLRTVLIDVLPEASKRPFICGSSGDEGVGVMPEFFLICPTYGADVRQTTKYIKETKDV